MIAMKMAGGMAMPPHVVPTDRLNMAERRQVSSLMSFQNNVRRSCNVNRYTFDNQRTERLRY